MTEFTFSRNFPQSYESTLAKVREGLSEAGFGVLTEIDVSATLKEKLDVDIPPQIILGACRPELAHQALQADPRIAAMMPCNVVVADEGDTTRVEVFDPKFMTSFSDAPELSDVASDAQGRLQKMLDGLAESD